jgi:hypothetical protein
MGVDLSERGPVIFVSSDWLDFDRMLLSELRYSQVVDALVFTMGPDELYEGHLSAEIESNHQTVVSTRNLEPDALAVQHPEFWSGSWISSEVQCAALTSLCQRSIATFPSGRLLQKSTSVFRAITRRQAVARAAAPG